MPLFARLVLLTLAIMFRLGFSVDGMLFSTVINLLAPKPSPVPLRHSVNHLHPVILLHVS